MFESLVPFQVAHRFDDRVTQLVDVVVEAVGDTHLVIGFPTGKATAIDFNTTAPAAARADMFPLDAQGRVRGGVNSHGWLAAGVPGTLAGLQLAIKRFGTRSLAQALEPAIGFTRDGFAIDAGQARALRAAAEAFKRDPASVKLLFADGMPLGEGKTFRNPDLAALLERLARDNSVADFYRGETARKITDEFRQHGGLVTEQDLAAYEAHEVSPLALEWNGGTILTAPLTAGGLSVLQALATLKSLGWEKLDPADPKTTQARVEALRLAWNDRLTLLGDPEATRVPVERLMSEEYAEASAGRVRQSVRERRLIPGSSDGRPAGGTIHLSAVDKSGLMVALTLTHGEGFGARVTVEGLGLILGHGMSRFNPRPGHPNSVQPGGHPLDNMCPTLVYRQNRPVIVLGATGGRRIPNTLYDVLVHLVGRNESSAAAAAAPRMHTEGDATL
jgi:gamma-glutamyltranspeptidase/glutathione hydrolase